MAPMPIDLEKQLGAETEPALRSLIRSMPNLARLVAQEERAACAELARAAGCLCHELVRGGRAVFRGSGHYESAVQVHDPRCPAAILAAIEARGRD